MILTLGKDIFEKVRAHNKEGRILNKQGYTVVELMAVVTSLAALSVVAFAIYAAIHFLSKW
jgi:type II secretory pathway component PulJ